MESEDKSPKEWLNGYINNQFGYLYFFKHTNIYKDSLCTRKLFNFLDPFQPHLTKNKQYYNIELYFDMYQNSRTQGINIKMPVKIIKDACKKFKPVYGPKVHLDLSTSDPAEEEYDYDSTLYYNIIRAFVIFEPVKRYYLITKKALKDEKILKLFASGVVAEQIVNPKINLQSFSKEQINLFYKSDFTLKFFINRLKISVSQLPGKKCHLHGWHDKKEMLNKEFVEQFLNSNEVKEIFTLDPQLKELSLEILLSVLLEQNVEDPSLSCIIKNYMNFPTPKDDATKENLKSYLNFYASLDNGKIVCNVIEKIIAGKILSKEEENHSIDFIKNNITLKLILNSKNAHELLINGYNSNNENFIKHLENLLFAEPALTKDELEIIQTVLNCVRTHCEGIKALDAIKNKAPSDSNDSNLHDTQQDLVVMGSTPMECDPD